MFIALNIGNTNIQAGAFEGRTLLSSWGMSSRKNMTTDELGHSLTFFLGTLTSRPRVTGIGVCSVVPSLTKPAMEMGEKYFRQSVFVVRPGVNTRMPIRCRSPRNVGADRIADAVAGFRKYGRSLVIADCGTATTVDYVTGKGEFIGGAIAPGLSGLTETLHAHTARLPLVEAGKPAVAIGRDTEEAMRSGVFYGYIGLVEGLVHRIIRERRGHPLVVSTGGLGRIVHEESSLIDRYEEYLALEGVRAIYEDAVS